MTFKTTAANLIYIIPLFLFGVFFVYSIYMKNKKFNFFHLSKMRNYKYSKNLFNVRIIFLFLSLIFIFISILRPAWGNKMKTVKSEGVDVVFTLDVSKSMKALDVGNGSVDRLTLSKDMIGKFVSLHPENRYGLVIFAGEAFVSTPLTIDASAFLTFLDGVDYNDVGTQGTDIHAALKASIDRFYSEQDKKRGRGIVIISDGGEEMEGGVSDFAKVANDLGIKIFTIGIGNTKGVPIPEGRDVFGRISYKQYQGKVVMTKLNEKVLKQIADETGGDYFHAEKQGDLEKITDELKKLDTTTIKTEQSSSQEDKYQYFLIFGLLFFVLYIFFEYLDQYMEPVIKKIFSYEKYLKMMVFVILTFSLSGCLNSNIAFRYYNTQGNKKFANDYLKEAKLEYEKASKSSDDLKYISENNSAVTSYKEEEYENGIKKIEEAISNYCEGQETKYCDILYYNIGNLYYRIGEGKEDKEQNDLWQDAIDSYKKDLDIYPEDKEAQENIDFILDKLKKQEESDSQQSENKKKDNENSASSSPENQDKGSGVQNNKGKQTDNQEGNKQSSDSQEATGNSEEQNQGEVKKGEPQKQENAQKGASQNKKESEKESNQSEDSASSQSFDETTNQQINNYLKELEKQEKNNQDYFQPNPNGSYDNNSPFDDFFNNSAFDDPFFQDFFNNAPFNGKFKDKNDSDGIDW